MMYSQYCRIESKAGGVTCTPRQFVRAAHSRITPAARRRAYRDARHAWLRDGLVHLQDAKALVRDFRL
jgi:hypothetical protein